VGGGGGGVGDVVVVGYGDTMSIHWSFCCSLSSHLNANFATSLIAFDEETWFLSSVKMTMN